MSKHRLANPDKTRSDSRQSMSKHHLSSVEKARHDSSILCISIAWLIQSERRLKAENLCINIVRLILLEVLNWTGNGCQPITIETWHKAGLFLVCQQFSITYRTWNIVAVSLSTHQKHGTRDMHTLLKVRGVTLWLSQGPMWLTMHLMTDLQDKFVSSKSVVNIIINGVSQLPAWKLRNSKAHKQSACMSPHYFTNVISH